MTHWLNTVRNRGSRSGARSNARLRRSGRIAAVTVVTAGLVAGAVALPAAAQAVTTVYEIEGNWAAGTPNPVQSGTGLTTVWRYNINDADPAPENPPQDNVTITFTAQHAVFTEIPSECLTSGVTPASEI